MTRLKNPEPLSNNVKIGIGQLAGKGVYANRDFEVGEIVIQYHLKAMTTAEYESLPEEERMFTHTHRETIYLYSEPERYVNHSEDPNTRQDLSKKCDVAIRRIARGDMITTDSSKDDLI